MRLSIAEFIRRFFSELVFLWLSPLLIILHRTSRCYKILLRLIIFAKSIKSWICVSVLGILLQHSLNWITLISFYFLFWSLLWFGSRFASMYVWRNWDWQIGLIHLLLLPLLKLHLTLISASLNHLLLRGSRLKVE